MEIFNIETGQVMTEMEFKESVPQCTFAVALSDADMLIDAVTEKYPNGVAIVRHPAPPSPSATQKVVAHGIQIQEDGTYAYSYSLTDKTTEDLDNDLNSKKIMKMSNANAKFSQLMFLIVSSYPEYEQKSFDKQEAEARAYQSNPAAYTPLIDALAENRQIDKALLVQKILAKAAAFSVIIGKLIGSRQKFEDAIFAATTLEELEAIDETSGWPTVA